MHMLLIKISSPSWYRVDTRRSEDGKQGIQTGITKAGGNSKANELANQKTNIRMLINQITKKKQGQDKSKQARKFSANPDSRRRPLKAQRYNRLNNS